MITTAVIFTSVIAYGQHRPRRSTSTSVNTNRTTTNTNRTTSPTSRAWATYSNGVLTFSYGEKPKAPTQIKCLGCGKAYPLSDNFCSSCGTKLDKDFFVYDAQTIRKDKWDGYVWPWIYDNEGNLNSKVLDNVKKIVINSTFSKFHPTNLSNYFNRLKYAREIVGLENLNTSKVTDMSRMFGDCSSLKTLDLSNFDTSNVTNMHQMFYYCDNLESINVSNFRTNKVTDMGMMFDSCKQLKSLDLSSFNTENVVGGDDMTGIYGMFTHCHSLQKLDLSNFNTSKVTSLGGMFEDCRSLTELNVSSFDTSNVTDMFDTFADCWNLVTLDLSNFDTRKTIACQMFFNCYKLKTVYVSAEKWNPKMARTVASSCTLYGSSFKGTIVRK